MQFFHKDLQLMLIQEIKLKQTRYLTTSDMELNHLVFILEPTVQLSIY